MKRLLCFLSFAAGLADAGGMVELSAASPRDDKIAGTLKIARLEAQVTMRGVLAETQATLSLAMEADPAQRMEGRLVFPLPPGCVVTGAALDIGDTMRPASMSYKSTAKQAYDSVVSRMLDPCLIQLLPGGRVSAQVFPFTGGVPRKLRLDFAQTVLPGATWRFPLTFSIPVPESILKTDAPVVSDAEERMNFSGGAEWSFTAPAEFAGDLHAHPDGVGRWFFQTLLPPGEPAEPPRHVLVLVDVSLLHAKRDAVAERVFLERLFQRMQSGRVTLATFSTALHSRTTYAVQEGQCGDVLAALDALTFDGAPRPGAVDVSGIPADLTLVLSTLSAPMGGGKVPRVPANAPVWVIDSVSSAPAAAALRLAGETGGMAFHPRAPPEISFRRRLAVTTENLTGVSYRLLPDHAWLVTGELSGERGAFTAAGMTMPVTKGADSAAGTLIAQERSRENFTRLAAERAGLLREDMRPGPNSAPFLTVATAFIVLEQASDYARWNIPLPPDMERNAPQAWEDQAKTDRAAIFEFDKALRRAAGTRGEPIKWYQRLRSDQKRSAVGERLENEKRFDEYRKPVHAWADSMGLAKEFNEMQERQARAQGELKTLADRFRGSTADKVPELVRLAREQQMARVKLAEWLEQFTGAMFSGTPGFDPMNFGYMMPHEAAGPFVGGHARMRPGTEVDRWEQGNDSAAVDPFASAGAVPGPSPTAPPPGDAVQTPQTFGGGGALFPAAGDRPPVREPFGLPPRMPARNSLTPVNAGMIAAATALHRDGKKLEAIRALSCMAIPGQHDHALLRLLAWVLLDWGEPAIAMEVLDHAERRFGSSDTTLRDLAVAEQAAGRRDDALRHFRAAWHHVARRDAAALDGRMSAALRIVLECAGSSADADLEIEGPDYELASSRNPLPAFGGALSFDGHGMEPEDFVLPARPSQPLKVRVRLTNSGPQPVRVTVIEEWGRPGEKRQVFLLPAAQPGTTAVTVVDAAK